jgi:hypothetical protein
MEMKIYSIFDAVASAFMQPQYFLNDGMAMRSLQQAVNAEEPNAIKNQPADFTLYHIGTFDDKKGELIPEEVPRRVTIAVELIEGDTKQYTNADLEGLVKQVEELKTQAIKDKNDLLDVLKNDIPELLKKQAE